MAFVSELFKWYGTISKFWIFDSACSNLAVFMGNNYYLSWGTCFTLVYTVREGGDIRILT